MKALDPRIKSVDFPVGKIQLALRDGRQLSMPISLYPPIAKLSLAQRSKVKILAGVGLMFDDSDYVYHISDFLGLDNSLGL